MAKGIGETLGEGDWRDTCMAKRIGEEEGEEKKEEEQEGGEGEADGSRL